MEMEGVGQMVDGGSGDGPCYHVVHLRGSMVDGTSPM